MRVGSSPTDGTKENNVKPKKERKQIMSYIDNITLRENAKNKLNSFDVEAFTLNNLPITLENMYIEGFVECDSKWRSALAKFAENHKEFTTKMFIEIIKYLNE